MSNAILRPFVDLQNKVEDLAASEFGPYSSGIWNPYASGTPTSHGFSTVPVGVYRYTVVGKICTLFVTEYTSGTSNGNTFNMDVPFAAKTVTNMEWGFRSYYAVNGTGVVVDTAIGTVSSGGILINLSPTAPGGGASWVTTGSKRASFTFTYEVA